MADTATRIGPTSIANTETTLVTVAASTTLLLQWYRITNVTGTAATVRMSIGADAVGTRLIFDMSIPANAFHDWTGFMPLLTTQTLRATGGTNNALTFTGGGVNVTS